MDDKDQSKVSRNEMENLSLDASRYSRDFLTRFTGSGWRDGGFGAKKEEGSEDEEGIELNLGLSLGGRFGVDKRSKKLLRSFSIAECLPIVKNEDDALTASPSPLAYSRLVRTSSLPLETEEEWKKRKELQTLRRFEAKRRRSEKQRNLKGEREEGSSGGSQMQEENKDTVDLNFRLEKDRLSAAANRIDSWVAPPFAPPNWAVAGKGAVPISGTGVAIPKGKATRELGQLLSQGSVEAQGGSSSELDNRSFRGSGSCGEVSPGSIHSLQESINQDAGSSGLKSQGSLGRTLSLHVENTSKRSDVTRNQLRESRSNALEDMPPVFTKGDGPNGKRVDGILYKYGKGEEVRIMCVCHGSFHTPAEFVKHAGGTDVAHPLKHIVVNPNSTPFM